MVWGWSTCTPRLGHGAQCCWQQRDFVTKVQSENAASYLCGNLWLVVRIGQLCLKIQLEPGVVLHLFPAHFEEERSTGRNRGKRGGGIAINRMRSAAKVIRFNTHLCLHRTCCATNTCEPTINSTVVANKHAVTDTGMRRTRSSGNIALLTGPSCRWREREQDQELGRSPRRYFR